MVELAVRVVFSLAVVLGLLMLCIRVAGRRFRGRGDAVIQVVHRQPVGRHSAISVVNVSGRLLVLGTTDQEVRLLTELDPESLDDHLLDDAPLVLVPPREPDDVGPPLETRGRHVAPRHVDRGPAASTAGREGLLGGSVLSPRTWRQAWGALTGRAS